MSVCFQRKATPLFPGLQLMLAGQALLSAESMTLPIRAKMSVARMVMVLSRRDLCSLRIASSLNACIAAGERHSSGVPAHDPPAEASGEAARGASADGAVVTANGNAADGNHVDAADQEQVSRLSFQVCSKSQDCILDY